MKYSVEVKFNNGWREQDTIEISGLTEHAAFNRITDDVIKKFKKKRIDVLLVNYHSASKSFYFEQLDNRIG